MIVHSELGFPVLRLLSRSLKAAGDEGLRYVPVLGPQLSSTFVVPSERYWWNLGFQMLARGDGR